MDDLTLLRELIQPDALISPQERERGTYYLRLEEITDDGRDCSISLIGVPHDAIAIKTDRFRESKDYADKHIFIGDKQENKRADFTIISPRDKIILHIEIKANKALHNEIEAQLRGAECFMDYVRSIGRSFWKYSPFLAHYTSTYLFVSIHNTSIPKRTTNQRPDASSGHTPGTMLRRSGAQHHFYQCIARR